MTLGAIYVRLGRETDAAGAYERALAAGCPRDEVIPLLAALYGVPADVMAEGKDDAEASMENEGRHRSLSSGGEISGSLQPPVTMQGGEAGAFHRAGPLQDRDVLVHPAEKVGRRPGSNVGFSRRGGKGQTNHCSPASLRTSSIRYLRN
jgi:hypothetical protein